jgi:adenosylcobinamide kinase/adenosylcobinamide-phosphate guanylyltransferase
MKRIILITGGQRSGKSSYAEQLAMSLSDNPIYMATAHVWDEEFAERVRKHKNRRGPEWTNIEEEFYLSSHNVNGCVVLIDCCTLWATNFFSKYRLKDDTETVPDVNLVLEEMCKEFDKFTAQEATFIFVTNEIGLGGTSPNALQRCFTDLLGWFNQYVASRANEVYFMVSGQPIVIKQSDLQKHSE